MGSFNGETGGRMGERMKRHALFVGVDQYADGHIPNLSCAVSDATDLHGFFKYGAGYDRVELLQNPAGKKEVLGAVCDLTAGLGSGDLFLFFFAGHGFRVGENHVLVCAKDLYEDVKYEDDGLPLGQLKRRLSGAFDSALFLDACQSDILATRGGEGIAERDLSLIHASQKDEMRGGNLTIVTSCDAGQTAAELSAARHGLFTMAMLDLLKSAQGTRARIDLSDAFRVRLGRKMGEIAARSGLPTNQFPRFSCTGDSSFVLLEGANVETVQRIHPAPDFRRSSNADGHTFARQDSGRAFVDSSPNLISADKAPRKNVGSASCANGAQKKKRGWLKAIAGVAAVLALAFAAWIMVGDARNGTVAVSSERGDFAKESLGWDIVEIDKKPVAVVREGLRRLEKVIDDLNREKIRVGVAKEEALDVDDETKSEMTHLREVIEKGMALLRDETTPYPVQIKGMTYSDQHMLLVAVKKAQQRYTALKSASPVRRGTVERGDALRAEIEERLATAYGVKEILEARLAMAETDEVRKRLGASNDELRQLSTRAKALVSPENTAAAPGRYNGGDSRLLNDVSNFSF